MPVNSLSQLLLLLLATVPVLALARRLRLPAILGYLIVGIAVGPHALGILHAGSEERALGEIGVVFLLFTLGLEFSFPRMVAMRREVFGVGSAQTLAISAGGMLLAHWAGAGWPAAIVMGGAMASCSTAIVVQQLGEQDELNRTHGRLSFAVLLFQDLAFVPLLALAGVLAQLSQGTPAAGGATPGEIAVRLAGLGALALAAVLALGRWVVRPLLHEIAHSRLRELFTLAALLVVLASAWLTERLGLSMTLGAFLAGMMLAESEYSHQIDAVIRPFRELLLGLFFLSVGALLNLSVLFRNLPTVIGLLALLTLAKALLSTLTLSAFGIPRFKALRTGVVLAGGGELGVALLTIVAAAPQLVPARFTQLLLAALVLGMIASPLIVRYNKRLARLLLAERGPPLVRMPAAYDATGGLAARDHVLLCGFGRVGTNLARVLVSQGFEFLALDLDPDNVRAARRAGEPVVWGDSADEQLLRNLGLDHATVVIVTFADPDIALQVVRSVRRVRADVPVLVRVQDDSRLAELSNAGATEVVPEVFEASLTLVSQALTLLRLPADEVTRVAEELRRARYGTLRQLAGSGARASVADGAEERLRSVVLPPGAWAVGRRLVEARAQGAAVIFAALHRHGIVGREPDAQTLLREGDVVVLYGSPADLEHAEAVLLAG
ncbi:MAG TPA: cation:proton antiporter [Steroidobacteraceae bacterium]